MHKASDRIGCTFRHQLRILVHKSFQTFLHLLDCVRKAFLVHVAHLHKSIFDAWRTNRTAQRATTTTKRDGPRRYVGKRNGSESGQSELMLDTRTQIDSFDLRSSNGTAERPRSRPKVRRRHNSQFFLHTRIAVIAGEVVSQRVRQTGVQKLPMQLQRTGRRVRMSVRAVMRRVRVMRVWRKVRVMSARTIRMFVSIQRALRLNGRERFGRRTGKQLITRSFAKQRQDDVH
jgi:hypothetical protein